MKRFTDRELENFLNNIESDLIERKQSFKGDTPKKARQAVCAFSNDLPNHRQPGVLFIGAKDDGTPSYEPITDELLRSLSDMKTDGNILPLPVLSVEKRKLKGAEMAVVTVLPSDMPPVKFEGRIWIRTGPRRSIANEQEERLLIERRRFRTLPYDLHPVPSATLKDLSKVFFEEEYLPKSFAPEILAANGRSYEERLASCRMINSPDDPVPTVLGILTLGKNPQYFFPGAYIQFLRIQGTKWSDPVIDEERIGGSLKKQLELLDQKLIAHNRVSVDFSSTSTEIRHYRYPLVALQQLTRNAVMHRSYEGTNSPIMVYWFDDRIEIINAGGAFGRVTPETFGKPGYADYRNPNIAESMKILGFVQRFGVGIRMAQDELKANGNPPAKFKVELTSVLCTIEESELTKSLQPELRPELRPELQPESKLASKIISFLRNKEMSKSEIAHVLGHKTVSGELKKQLKELLENKLIEMTIPEKLNSPLQKYRLIKHPQTQERKS
ncbi:MAG: ATP-binding protein [Victivallaceae bacterium]